MKVLLSMANNSSTPYFTRFANLERALPELELQFLCLYPIKPDMIEEMEEKGFTCFWINYDSRYRKTQLIIAFIRALKLLRRIRPDVVHVHLFDDALPVLLASKLLGIRKRVISKLDSGYHYFHTPKWVWFDKLNNRLATHIVAVSEENKKFIIGKELAPVDKIHLIYQGLALDELAGGDPKIRHELIERYQLKNKKIILCVARYIKWKGHEIILEAVAQLKIDHKNLRLLFFGEGTEKDIIIKRSIELGIEDIVHFGDWISRKELNHLYEISDVYCNASINEPFGFVIAEALLKRIPLVTTRTGAASSLINHNQHAFLADRTPENIALGLDHVLSNDMEDMISKGYNLAEDNFLVDSMWEKHKLLYNGNKL